MKRIVLSIIAVLALSLGFAGLSKAEDKAKTVSGKSACATCSGVTAADHALMLVDDKGDRWVLTGDSDSYKAAHKERKNDKKMTATISGEVTVKKDENGKAYNEAKASDVKIES